MEVVQDLAGEEEEEEEEEEGEEEEREKEEQDEGRSERRRKARVGVGAISAGERARTLAEAGTIVWGRTGARLAGSPSLQPRAVPAAPSFQARP